MYTQPDDLIEDALRTYPLQDAPPSLSQKIMGQIRAKDARTNTPPSIRFRLTWMDYAVGFFLALLPMAGFVIWATLPRLFLLRLAFQWQMIQTNGFYTILVLSLAVTVGLLLSAILFSVNLVLRPEPSFQ